MLLDQCWLKSWTGGVKYDGFTYYPRPGEKDNPKFEPSKLWMVQRIKPYKGNAKYLRRIMFQFRLDGKCGGIEILKNIPEIYSMLYKLKHLAKVTPFRTPNGLSDADDLSAGYLKPNGEFLKYSNRI